MSSEHAHSMGKIFQRDPLDCDAQILAMLLMQMRHVSVSTLPISLVISPVFSSRAQIMHGTAVNIIVFPARSFILLGSIPNPTHSFGHQGHEKASPGETNLTLSVSRRVALRLNFRMAFLSHSRLASQVQDPQRHSDHGNNDQLVPKRTIVSQGRYARNHD